MRHSRVKNDVLAARITELLTVGLSVTVRVGLAQRHRPRITSRSECRSKCAESFFTGLIDVSDVRAAVDVAAVRDP